MPRNSEMLLEIHRHSSWANGQILQAAARMPVEQLRTPIGEGGYGDMLETLLHMYDAQKAWFDRARTGTNGPALDIEVYRDIPTLAAAWRELDAEMEQYITGLDDQALEEEVAYRSYYGSEGTYSRDAMMLHQALHSHQHRGEVALLLTQLGYSPGEIDFLDYVEAKREG